MSDDQGHKDFQRAKSISLDAALEVGASNICRSRQEIAENNPEFFAESAKEKLQEFTLVVCGGPRTGKSTLINAILNKDLAKVRPGFAPVTMENTCYKLDGIFPEIVDEQTGEKQQESQPFQISVWDTKGITTWNESIVKIIREHNPMCVLLCSSPGSFAKDDFIKPLIQECVNLNVLVALVCTNRWNDSDIKRQRVMEEFHDLLKIFNTNIREEDGIRYYGDIGLIAMVNSVPYVNNRVGIYKPKSGVGTLLYGIMRSLSNEKLMGWCYTLMENEGFWTQMQTHIQEFFAGKFTYGKSILWSLSRYMTMIRK
ncbi:unnamed protein product [Rotaria sp. Silwood2]|nr:unnamed protein product [Rotaria sp. Silwood2]CAF4737184.1 unnamed protein product [Rotaria sp. Silwood2]